MALLGYELRYVLSTELSKATPLMIYSRSNMQVKYIYIYECLFRITIPLHREGAHAGGVPALRLKKSKHFHSYKYMQ